MKAILRLFLPCLLAFAGCATSENGKVQSDATGTRVYGLNDQPQSSVSGEGSLMPGVYDSRHLPTGQFTGQERTQNLVGQRPTLPREADARQFDHSAPPILGSGAGTLGQTGIRPDSGSVNGAALNEAPLNPALEPAASDIRRPSGPSEEPPAIGNALALNNPPVSRPINDTSN